MKSGARTDLRPKWSIRAKDYSDATGLTEKQATIRLNRLVAEGIAESDLKYDPEVQREVRCWWFADDGHVHAE